jgi:hypothetical protein
MRPHNTHRHDENAPLNLRAALPYGPTNANAAKPLPAHPRPGLWILERKLMAEIEWKPLPPLWPPPAEFADVGECMLLVFTQDSVPTWEVRRRSGGNETDLIVSGTADTFEAAKAAAHFEASAHARSSRRA